MGKASITFEFDVVETIQVGELKKLFEEIAENIIAEVIQRNEKVMNIDVKKVRIEV